MGRRKYVGDDMRSKTTLNGKITGVIGDTKDS